MSQKDREYIQLNYTEDADGTPLAMLTAIRKDTNGIPSYVGVRLNAEDLANHIASAETILEAMTE